MLLVEVVDVVVDDVVVEAVEGAMVVDVVELVVVLALTIVVPNDEMAGTRKLLRVLYPDTDR